METKETKKTDLILAATDFHDVADFAIEHAVGIAKVFSYKVVVLHVKTKKSKYSDAEIVQKLETVVNNIKNTHNVSAEYIIKEGDPLNAIDETASELGANYLTMGTRGKTGVEYIFGSYAAKIIQNSPVPVIVVQKKHFDVNGYKNIVIPIDNTSESKQTVKWALLIAKKWQSKVHVFGKTSNDEFIWNKTLNNVKVVKKIFEENGIYQVDKFSEDKKASFGKQTIQYAIDIKADLIAATTKLDILIPGLFSMGIFGGGYDEQFIMDASQIPIMCINPQEYNVIIGGL